MCKDDNKNKIDIPKILNQDYFFTRMVMDIIWMNDKRVKKVPLKYSLIFLHLCYQQLVKNQSYISIFHVDKEVYLIIMYLMKLKSTSLVIVFPSHLYGNYHPPISAFFWKYLSFFLL